MNDFISDVGIPVFTFLAGWFLENYRQNKQVKNNNINEIHLALQNFIEKTGKGSKIYILKYDYNHIVNLVYEFCTNYNFDKQYFSDDLINLSIHSVQRRNPDKLSECSISIMKRIRSI